MNSNTYVELPEGSRIIHRVGYKIPDKFDSLQDIRPTGRKWWQIWLPKNLVIYTLVEKIPDENS